MIDTSWGVAFVLLSTLTNDRWCPVVALLDDMLTHLAQFVKKLSAYKIDTVEENDQNQRASVADLQHFDVDPDPTFKFHADPDPVL